MMTRISLFLSDRKGMMTRKGCRGKKGLLAQRSHSPLDVVALPQDADWHSTLADKTIKRTLNQDASRD